MRPEFAPHTFTWITGVEDTCVYPPTDFDMTPLDEYELTEHNANWRQDLRKARDIGATAIRYGVNWPLVHTAPGLFDWAILDERFDFACRELGLTVVADLVHYGTPTWLVASFADPGYPAAVRDFAGAFAERYRGLVDHITPLNEPLTTASFSGLRGVWPPALTGWDGWTTVMLGIVAGMRETIEAVRAANPGAVVVHVEAASLYQTSESELETRATFLHALGFLPTDLLLGRVDADHVMHDWLIEHGAGADSLRRLTIDVPSIDFVGVNYYPDLSPRTLVDVDGTVAQVATNRWHEGLTSSLRRFSNRYGLPILVTETSIEGGDELRTSWLAESAEAVRSLIRDEDLDIRGYTWWPLMDFVDWSYASGGRNVEEFVLSTAEMVSDPLAPAAASSEGSADVPRPSKADFLRRMGLVRLSERPDGTLERIPTEAAERFRLLSGAAAATVDSAPDARDVAADEAVDGAPDLAVDEC